MHQSVLNVFVGQMKIAAQAELEGIADQSLKVRNLALQVFAFVGVAIVGVRRGHHVSNAVSSGRFAHGDGDVPGLGTVIDFGKDVRVDIDHNAGNTSTPGGVASL